MSKKGKGGFGDPSEHSQFKKGESGNPKGRPKGSKNFSTDVKEALQTPVRVNSGGRSGTVSTQEATLMRLREKALKGDARALDRMIELARTYNDEETAEAADKLSQTDAEVMKAYDERLLRKAGMSQPGDSGDPPNDAARATEATTDTDDALEQPATTSSNGTTARSARGSTTRNAASSFW